MRNFSNLRKRKKKKANVYLGKSGVYWNIFSIPKSKQEYTILNGIDLEVLGNINKNVSTCICYFCQKIITRPLKCCNRGFCYSCFQSFVFIFQKLFVYKINKLSLKLLANKMPSLQTYKFGKNNHLSFKNSLFHHQS